MDPDKLQGYLRNIEGWVMDEEKIVTYKFISRNLSLHVNAAKQLLHIFLVQQQKLNPSAVSASYLLAGSVKDGGYLVEITTDDAFNYVYSKFNKITSEHVYSVQKGKTSSLSKNPDLLYVVDSQLDPPRSYPVTFSKAVKGKPSEVNRVTPDLNIDDELKKKSEEIGEKKSSLRIESPRKAATGNKKQNPISILFNKETQKKKVEKHEAKEVTGKSDVQLCNDSTEVTEQISKSTTEEVSPKQDKKKPKYSAKNGNSVSEKKTNFNDKKKKRKRIVCDSEDSESDEEMRDAELCMESDIVESGGSLKILDDPDDPPPFKRKRKKTVDRTHRLDDGYLETVKEVVYETDTDDESVGMEEKKAKTSDDGALGKRITDATNSETARPKNSTMKTTAKKQSTLFSFFKKN